MAELKTRKLTTMALLTAIALTMFIIENQIPLPVAIPGMKLGLSNIITVYAVFAIGAKEGAAILFARVFLGAIFSGNFGTIFYSAAGGVLAILTTIALKPVLRDGQLWVAGVLGAIAHILGQMVVAVWATGTTTVLLYLPALVVCSVFTGLFTGLCAQLILKRGKRLWKTIFK